MTEVKKKQSFVLYASQYESIKDLSCVQKALLLDSIFQYVLTSEVPAIDDGEVKMAFRFIKNQVDFDNEKYESICAKRREYGKRGGEAKATKSYQKPAYGDTREQMQASVADKDKDKDKDNDKDKDKDKDKDSLEPNGSMKEGYDNIPPLPPSMGDGNVDVSALLDKINALESKIEDLQKKKRTTFTPPTEEELTEHIKEKGYHFSAEDFIAFYESKGWMIGKNKMKDWKAACRTWERSRTDAKQTGMSIGIMHDNSDTEKYKKMELW